MKNYAYSYLVKWGLYRRNILQFFAVKQTVRRKFMIICEKCLTIGWIVLLKKKVRFNINNVVVILVIVFYLPHKLHLR